VWAAKPRLAAIGALQLREALNYRSSESRPADAGALGLTGSMEPASTQPRWLGEKPAPVTQAYAVPKPSGMQWTSKLRSSCS
jgi:hypothetical protein